MCDKKRQLLYACEDGCVDCVEHLVLQEGVPVDTQSRTTGFSAIDFAYWGREQAKKRRHGDVVVFLQEHGQGVVPRNHAATPTLPQPFIRCWRQHGPRNRTSPNKYKLFYAAMDGCLECVTRLVLREGVPTDVVSDTHKYAVSDYVEWGAKHGREGSHEDVKSFLREQAGLASGSASLEPEGSPSDLTGWTVVP